MWELGKFATWRRLINILLDISLQKHFSSWNEPSMCVRMPFNEYPQYLVVVLVFFEVLFVFVGFFSIYIYILKL